MSARRAHETQIGTNSRARLAVRLNISGRNFIPPTRAQSRPLCGTPFVILSLSPSLSLACAPLAYFARKTTKLMAAAVAVGLYLLAPPRHCRNVAGRARARYRRARTHARVCVCVFMRVLISTHRRLCVLYARVWVYGNSWA